MVDEEEKAFKEISRDDDATWYFLVKTLETL